MLALIKQELDFGIGFQKPKYCNFYALPNAIANFMHILYLYVVICMFIHLFSSFIACLFYVPNVECLSLVNRIYL